MKNSIRFLFLAVLGGLWGGAVAGLAEALTVISMAAELPEYGLVPYAILGYALLGGAAGLAFGIAGALVAPLRRRFGQPFSWAGGAMVAALVFVVGRYHVNLRYFHEELTPWTAAGAGAYVGLLLLAALAAALLVWLGRIFARRPLAGWVALAAVCVLALAVGRAKTPTDTLPGPGPTRAAAPGRPNIVLVIADTLRADGLSCYGNAQQTPAIDSLARDGILFETAYAQSSWTRPSIATILTSLYPAQHGAMSKQAILPDRVTTIAEVLRDAGYRTAAFVSNINVAPIFNFQQGFAEYTYLPPDFYFGASDSSARLALYRIARVVRERFFARSMYVDNFYQDALVVTGRAREWLASEPRPRPFFLLVHYMDPHDPFMHIPYDGRGIARVTNPDPPASEAGAMHALYQENIGYLDEHLAGLWQDLKSLGLYDDTIIAFTADHGEEFQEHGGWWHGTTLYEEQLHVPLVVKLPGLARAGTRVAEPVRTLDIPPTLLAASGLASPPAFMGVDVLSAPESARPLYAEEDHEGNVVHSLRQGDWKLITANAGNPRGLPAIELFDLANDPLERRNLATSQPERVTELSQALARERATLRSGAGGR
jgi:arylsulfatase A-like enzyme